jgi:hypothetical protein
MHVNKDNECELALAIQGNRVTAYVDGRVAIEVTDDDSAEGSPVLAVRNQGHSEFRDAELFILDGTKLTPDEVMRKHSPPGPNDDWARPIALELLDHKNMVTVKVATEQPQEIQEIEQLPAAPFELRGMTVRQERADELISRLSGIGTILALKFDGSDLTDEGAAHVAKFKALRAVDVSGTKVTDRGVLKLRVLRSLEKLTASKEQLTDEVRQTFARELPDCELVVAGTALE